ncbi:MAG: RHS repeat-associated core domain-containing protein [Bryobacteraceae bacterium]
MPLPEMSPLDGTTPGINTPGSPDGVFHLSSLDTVNHANGHLNISIPLTEALGRGDAKAPLILPIESHWYVQTITAEACGASTSSSNLNCQRYTGYLPLNESWQADEPNIVQGAMQMKGTGDVCKQETTGPNNIVYQWNSTLTRLTYTGPDGTEHDFRDQNAGGVPVQTSLGASFDRGTVFQAFDGSDALFTSSSHITESSGNASNSSCIFPSTNTANTVGVTGMLQLKNGTTYTLTTGFVTQIEDRNGNTLSVGNQYGTYPLSITDGLNRLITISDQIQCPVPSGLPALPAGAQAQYITYPDANGSPSFNTSTPALAADFCPNSVNSGGHVIALTYQPLDAFVVPQNTATLFSAIPSCIGSACTESGPGGNTQIPTPATLYDPAALLQSVRYPDGTSLTFSYDVYGDVSQIVLPTGGMYRYTYGITVGTSGSTLQNTICAGGGTCPSGYVIESYVTEKDIYTNASDATPSQKVFFCPLGNSLYGPYFAQAGIVIYTDGTVTSPYTGPLMPGGAAALATFCSQYSNGGPGVLGVEDHYTYPVDQTPPFYNTYYKGWQEGKEVQTNLYDGSNNLLQTEKSTWQQRLCDSSEINTLDPATGQPPCWFAGYENATTLPSTFTNQLAASVSPVIPEHDPRIVTKTVTLGSVTATDQYTYDDHNNQIEDDESDYTGSLIRATVTNYQYDIGTPSLPPYILDLPSVRQVCNATSPTLGTLCPSANVVSETDYAYDQTSPQGYSSVTSHDGTNYGAGSGTARGNVATVTQKVTDPVNGPSTLTSTYTYDIAGNVVQTLDPRTVQHNYNYTDSSGGSTYAFPTSVTSYTGLNGTGTALTARAAYDYNIGKPISTTDVNGNTTSYAYLASAGADAFDRLTGVARPDGGSTTIVYNDTPSAFSVTSYLAQSSGTYEVTEVDYDGLGRKAGSELSDAGSTSTTGGPPSGNWIATTYGYDGRGRQSCVSLPLRSQKPFATCSSSNATTTLYDGINRPTKVTEADGSTTQIAYLNNQTYAQDPAGFVRLSAVDAAGRLTSVQENPTSSLPSGITNGSGSTTTYNTTYTYDPLDDLTSVIQTDPSGAGTLQRTFTYDSLKRLVKAANPENGTLTYSYDQSGNLLTRTDAVRMLTFSAYDGMNRVIGKSYSGVIPTPPVTYSYCDATGTCTGGCNENGRLASVSTIALASTSSSYPSAPATTNSYSCFDRMGRVANSSQQIGNAAPYSFSYLYDKSGALKSVTYPSGRTVTNTFDAAGRINQVTGAPSSGASTTYASGGSCFATGIYSPYSGTGICYAPQGAVENLSLGNNVTENWNFNSLLQPTQLTATLGSTALMTLGWSYNSGADNGNVAGHTIQRTSGLATEVYQNYNYTDPANRLNSASEATSPSGPAVWSQTYNYDAFGNRAVTPSSYMPNAGFTPTGAVTAVYPNSNNRLVRGAGDTYDGAGNQMAWATAPASQSGSWFSYDGENRLLTANVANGVGVASFVYDGEGRRVQKTSGSGATSVTTTYVHDAKGDLAAEYSTAAPVVTGTQYLTADLLGSTRLITDNSGTQTNWRCFDYLPFGEEIPAGENGRSGCYETMNSPAQYPTSADVVNQKFTGKERDAETGLDYFGERYFSSAQGRWTSPDAPFADQQAEDPQSWNMYGYVRNNPLKNTDPDGRDCFQGVSSCANYVLGGLGAVANAISSDVINLPNRVIDSAISPFTSFRFGDAVPAAFTPVNQDQQQGMQAAQAVMLVAPVAAALSGTKAVEAAAEVPLVTQNAARGTASEARVLNDMGLTKNTEPVVASEGKSIPDFQTKTTVGEIKDVKQLSNTQQLRIQREAAQQSGREHVVVTGTKTNVTPNVQKPPTKVVRRDDLGPSQ